MAAEVTQFNYQDCIAKYELHQSPVKLCHNYRCMDLNFITVLDSWLLAECEIDVYAESRIMRPRRQIYYYYYYFKLLDPTGPMCLFR